MDFQKWMGIVTDTNGCENTSNIISINVNPKPVADFIVDGICTNIASQFINTSTVSLGNIVSSFWYLGNGEVVNGDSLLYTYTFAGDYFTQLFVTSNYGCIDSIGKFYSIYNNPIASFEYNQHSHHLINTTRLNPIFHSINFAVSQRIYVYMWY